MGTHDHPMFRTKHANIAVGMQEPNSPLCSRFQPASRPPGSPLPGALRSGRSRGARPSPRGASDTSPGTRWRPAHVHRRRTGAWSSYPGLVEAGARWPLVGRTGSSRAFRPRAGVGSRAVQGLRRVGGAACGTCGVASLGSVPHEPGTSRPQAGSGCRHDPAHLRGQAEHDVLARRRGFTDDLDVARPEPVAHAPDEMLGRRGAGGQPGGSSAFEPALVDRALVLDQVGCDARRPAPSRRDGSSSSCSSSRSRARRRPPQRAPLRPAGGSSSRSRCRPRRARRYPGSVASRRQRSTRSRRPTASFAWRRRLGRDPAPRRARRRTWSRPP